MTRRRSTREPGMSAAAFGATFSACGPRFPAAPKFVQVAPGIRAELREQPSGSFVYTLFDRYSRAIGTEEVFGSEARTIECAKAFAAELVAAHQVSP